MRTRTLLTAAVSALALTAAPAWAFWTNTGTGTATATADALGIPQITATGVAVTATFVGHTGGGGTVAATGFTAYAGASSTANAICTSSSPTGTCSGVTLNLVNAVFNIRYNLAGSTWISLTPEVCTFGLLGLTSTCSP
jgi:hypothetical protein